MAAKAIPDGYHSVTPYLIVDGAARAIEFYRQAFGATELYRLPGPGGSVAHAEVDIGNSRIILADGAPEAMAKSPTALGGTSIGLVIYTEDADALFDRAVAAGATVTRPLATQFYGDRTGTVKDPFGHQWTLATHVEDVSPEEMNRRLSAMMGSSG